MEENAGRKEKFKQSVVDIFAELKLGQDKKASDGKKKIDDLEDFKLRLEAINSLLDASSLINLEVLRDKLLEKIKSLQLDGSDEDESLKRKIEAAYKEAQEPSKFDAAARIASAAIDSAKETAANAAGSAKKKFLSILPRSFRAPVSEESLRPREATDTSGFSLTDSPPSASPPTGSPPTGSPSQSEKVVARKKKRKPPVSEQVALPTQNVDEEARRAEEERKVQEAAAAELKRQEEAAGQARLAKEAEERRVEEERQKAEEARKNAEQERLREIEKAEQARLKQIEDERIAREVAERERQEAQRRAEEHAAEQKRLQEEREISEKARREEEAKQEKITIETRLAEIPRVLEEKSTQLKDKREALGRLNTHNQEIRNNFYVNYILPDLKAKQESLVPIKFLFKGRLRIIEEEGRCYTSATTDEDKSKIVDKLANTGIYRFEFVRQALSSFYEKRKTSYKKYLEMCQGAEQIKNNMKGDQSMISQALLPLTLGDFSKATNDEFRGEDTATKRRLLPGEPFGTKEWLVHHLEQKADLDNNVLQLEYDIVALQNEIPQRKGRLAELNAQLNPGRQEQEVDEMSDKSNAYTL